ncbi:D-alanyl-D-alanine carboxypeptidase (penicillin-binding protein 5/6) [Proteiniborus sp. DW1]|uniref:D-alanyl-D-alanine carboxypeptidase family protein n=1 Tax=Proteiniborus sp. DW1 TaxID=1889883 RepID=UPI00092DF1A8|nr:D-alanyl-D-alanine carboxypeptidase family protein [Proteiniborus sp. DW1]SCG83342.1 D-alanyl-D-alanine carboxypeptidase (penicillin-binding protein 5/6) [Proteiniborus sp. DW1]
MLRKIKIVVVILISVNLLVGFAYPSPSAESAVLIDSKTGRVIYSLNHNLRRPMASTTKIMTALLAIEHGNLDSIVKVKENAVGVEGSSIYLVKGEEILLKDLIYGLMLRSGNDAAVAIAEHISGSVDKFVDLMNEKARDIGALNTNFVNPHGLHDPNHFSTAYDMAIITREAMKLDFFREVSKAKNWIANREINQYFSNKNDVVWKYNGGDGVKIGYTKTAGRCLVASATRNEMQLIAVVLNDGNWFNDCYNMLDYGFEKYKPTLLLSEGQFLRKVEVLDGDRKYLNIKFEEDLIIPLDENEKEKTKVVLNLLDTIKAPVSKGQKLGNVQVFIEGELIYTTEIKANTEISYSRPNGNFIKFLKNIF